MHAYRHQRGSDAARSRNENRFTLPINLLINILPGAAALEGHCAMAALALPSELARVDIILLMTRHAVLRKLDFGRRLAMAVGALDFSVRASEAEACLLKMIEYP